MAEFVEPAGSYTFDPATDTVTTHMLVEDKDGNFALRPVFKATASIFLQWMVRGDQCRAEIEKHRTRQVVALLPKAQKKAGA